MKGSNILLATVALVLVGAGSAVAQDTARKAPPAKAAVSKAPSKATAAAPAFSVDDIKAAQAGLAKGKFYTGTPSGRVDAATRAAIRKYQQANKLKVTGALSDSLIAALKAAQ